MDFSTDDAKKFVAELWRGFEKIDCPEKFNVVRVFRDHLADAHGVSVNIAEEAARRLQRTLSI